MNIKNNKNQHLKKSGLNRIYVYNIKTKSHVATFYLTGYAHELEAIRVFKSGNQYYVHAHYNCSGGTNAITKTALNAESKIVVKHCYKNDTKNPIKTETFVGQVDFSYKVLPLKNYEKNATKSSMSGNFAKGTKTIVYLYNN